ncbi:MAG: hypothetical protein ACTHKG_14245, partial [Nocardioides sp.]
HMWTSHHNEMTERRALFTGVCSPTVVSRPASPPRLVRPGSPSAGLVRLGKALEPRKRLRRESAARAVLSRLDCVGDLAALTPAAGALRRAAPARRCPRRREVPLAPAQGFVSAVGTRVALVGSLVAEVGAHRAELGALVALVGLFLAVVGALVALVGLLLAVVGALVTVVGALVALVGALVALVGAPVALVGLLLAVGGALVTTAGVTPADHGDKDARDAGQLPRAIDLKLRAGAGCPPMDRDEGTCPSRRVRRWTGSGAFGWKVGKYLTFGSPPGVPFAGNLPGSLPD